jgi:hypothetical protein
MYNKDVLNALIVEFGIENAIIYCKMESRKSQLMLDDSIRRGEIGSSEWEFERDWWKENETELLTINLNQNANKTIVRKSPQNNISNKRVVFRNNSRNHREKLSK